MNRLYPQKMAKAFTLIELMFTIAVMSVFATLGIAAYQQKMQTAKIEQAALQIQTWLQAGLAYRVQSTNDTWPTMQDLIQKGYIVNYSTPWKACDKNTVLLCYTVGTAPDSGNFIVNMRLPGNLANAEKIANLIINRLPNAHLDTSSGIAVSSSIPMPAQSAVDKNRAVVLDIQQVIFDGNASSLKVPYNVSPTHCPKGTSFSRNLSLSGFDSWSEVDVKSGAGYVLLKNEEVPGAMYSKVLLDVQSLLGKSHTGVVTVIDACIPLMSSATETKNNTVNYFY